VRVYVGFYLYTACGHGDNSDDVDEKLLIDVVAKTSCLSLGATREGWIGGRVKCLVKGFLLAGYILGHIGGRTQVFGITNDSRQKVVSQRATVWMQHSKSLRKVLFIN